MGAAVSHHMLHCTCTCFASLSERMSSIWAKNIHPIFGMGSYHWPWCRFIFDCPTFDCYIAKLYMYVMYVPVKDGASFCYWAYVLRIIYCVIRAHIQNIAGFLFGREINGRFLLITYKNAWWPPFFMLKKGSGKPIQHMIVFFLCVQKLFRRLYFWHTRGECQGW